MKSVQDMLHKAVVIADLDPNAFIGVFADKIRYKHRPEEWIGSGLFKSAQNMYVSENGARIALFNCTKDVSRFVAGYQFTHVFITSEVDYQTRQFLSSRIRYTKKPDPTPAGLYDDYGLVQRWETW